MKTLSLALLCLGLCACAPNRPSKSETLYAHLARDYIAQGDYALAHIKLQDLARSQPVPSVYYSLSAYLAEREGRNDEVQPFYQAGLRAYPNNVALLNNYGVWLSHHGQKPRAVLCFKRALKFASAEEAGHIQANLGLTA